MQMIGASFHASSNCLANRNARWVEARKTKNIYSEVIWSNALSMEWIDSTNSTEVVSRGFGMKLILSQ